MKLVAFSAAATGVMARSFATVVVAVAKITVGSTETHVDWDF
jgi:hypothetical protein